MSIKKANNNNPEETGYMLCDNTFLEKSSVAGVATVALALIALSWVALRPAAMPEPAPANAPPADFSAARAAAHVAYLAQTPRPLASAANAQARQYIIDRIRATGLEPQVQTATARKATRDIFGNVHVTMAVVNNILVRKPGTRFGHASRPATLLVSHYDSGERSLGAANGGAAVAAMLETLRALQAAAPLANDLLFLFADGDEAGAMGARGFAEQHPWAEQVGLVLKFDSGGSRGPVMLFGTSGEDGAAIDGWARATPRPLGSSFLNAVFSLTAGAEAMDQLGQVASAGLRFANIEGSTGRVGSLDTPDRLDGGTLQQIGETMLGLARHFGQLAPARAEDGKQVYFTLPGIGAVHYSYALIWPLTRLVCLLFAGLCCLAVQHGELEPLDIVHGAIGFVFIGAMLALSAFLLWEWLPAQHPAYRPLVFGAGRQDRCYLLAFATLATGVFVLLQRLLQRRLGVPAAALGAMLTMVILLLFASWQMPGATYALTWPLLGAIIAFGMLYAPRVAALPHNRRLLILLAGAAPGVILIAPLVRDVFTLLTLQRMNLPIAVLALLLGLCTALLAAARSGFVVGGLALACAASIAAARSRAPTPPSCRSRTAWSTTRTRRPGRRTGCCRAQAWIAGPKISFPTRPSRTCRSSCSATAATRCGWRARRATRSRFPTSKCSRMTMATTGGMSNSCSGPTTRRHRSRSGSRASAPFAPCSTAAC
jgi:hypothetical protein